MSQKTMALKEFLEEVCINQMGHCIKHTPYHSVPTLGAICEFIGSLFDKRGLHECGFSKKRFIKTMLLLSSITNNQDYDNNKIKLYEYMRCSMNHVFVPNNCLLSSNKTQRGGHLQQNNHPLHINLSQFHIDLTELVKKICLGLASKKLYINQKKTHKILKTFPNGVLTIY